MPLDVQTARADDYGDWIAVKNDSGETVYVWGCGCCNLAVTSVPPEIDGEWKPVEVDGG